MRATVRSRLVHDHRYSNGPENSALNVNIKRTGKVQPSSTNSRSSTPVYAQLTRTTFTLLYRKPARGALAIYWFFTQLTTPSASTCELPMLPDDFNSPTNHSWALML
jgi:hypothetical protein